jgi:hypothetical protein
MLSVVVVAVVVVVVVVDVVGERGRCGCCYLLLRVWMLRWGGGKHGGVVGCGGRGFCLGGGRTEASRCKPGGLGGLPGYGGYAMGCRSWAAPPTPPEASGGQLSGGGRGLGREAGAGHAGHGPAAERCRQASLW